MAKQFCRPGTMSSSPSCLPLCPSSSSPVPRTDVFGDVEPVIASLVPEGRLSVVPPHKAAPAEPGERQRKAAKCSQRTAKDGTVQSWLYTYLMASAELSKSHLACTPGGVRAVKITPVAHTSAPYSTLPHLPCPLLNRFSSSLLSSNIRCCPVFHPLHAFSLPSKFTLLFPESRSRA